MNVYMVDAGVVEVCAEDMGELGAIYQPERVIDIVFAETRSQAQYLFWQAHLTREGDLHEFNYKTRLLKRDIDPAIEDIGLFWAMVGKREPLLEKLMREKGYYSDPEFWAERIDLELGEMLALHGHRGLTMETLRAAVRVLADRLGHDDAVGRWT